MYTLGVVMTVLGLVGLAVVRIFWSKGTGFWAASSYYDYTIPAAMVAVGLTLGVTFY